MDPPDAWTDATPNWQLVLRAAHALTKRGRHVFGLGDLIREVQEDHPERKRISLQPTIQGMTDNAGTGPPSPCGKVLHRVRHGEYQLVGELTKRATPGPEPRQAPLSERSSEAEASRIAEDDVKRAVKTHLEARGYTTQVAWGRERGVDIDATKAERRFLIEAKGEAKAGPQQVNHFIGALGELVQRMTDPDAAYAIALPDHKQYHGLVKRLPAHARRRLNLHVFFVDATGSVTELEPPAEE